MNYMEFFFAVANMRAAQKSYLKSRTQGALKASIMAEREIDAEIRRVKEVLYRQEHGTEDDFIKA